MTKDKKAPTKQQTKKFVPDDIDKNPPAEPYGNGIGSVLLNYKFRPEGTKDIKTVDSTGDEDDTAMTEPYSPSKDNEFVLLVQTKLFDKLSKMASDKAKKKD